LQAESAASTSNPAGMDSRRNQPARERRNGHGRTVVE